MKTKTDPTKGHDVNIEEQLQQFEQLLHEMNKAMSKRRRHLVADTLAGQIVELKPPMSKKTLDMLEGMKWNNPAVSSDNILTGVLVNGLKQLDMDWIGLGLKYRPTKFIRTALYGFYLNEMLLATKSLTKDQTMKMTKTAMRRVSCTKDWVVEGHRGSIFLDMLLNKHPWIGREIPANLTKKLIEKLSVQLNADHESLAGIKRGLLLHHGLNSTNQGESLTSKPKM